MVSAISSSTSFLAAKAHGKFLCNGCASIDDIYFIYDYKLCVFEREEKKGWNLSCVSIFWHSYWDDFLNKLTMRKNIFFLFLLCMIVSCKKEETEIKYIRHDSPIFTGADSLIYGEWEYLFTDHETFGGSYTQDDGIDSLKIEPNDNYSVFRDGLTSNGKIDTVGSPDESIYRNVIFYKDGIFDPNRVSEVIFVVNSDTLVKGILANDASILLHYKRIKRIAEK